MGVVNPLTKEQASPELQGAFEKLAARAGKVPNIFAAMAHRPAVLNTFLPLYRAVINEALSKRSTRNWPTFARR